MKLQKAPCFENFIRVWRGGNKNKRNESVPNEGSCVGPSESPLKGLKFTTAAKNIEMTMSFNRQMKRCEVKLSIKLHRQHYNYSFICI